MPKPFFSIIVPAYNAEGYLPGCIDSLLCQSWGGFEVILVDDASTDGTAALASRLAAGDGRIRVVSIPHSGVSGARNAGLAAAAGEYVLFVDADDSLVPDALERLRAKLEGRPDLLWFGFLYQWEDGSIREGKKLQSAAYTGAPEAAADWIRDNMLPVSACSKVFRLAVIREFGIAFRAGYAFGEDRLFNLDFLRHCARVVTIPDLLYVYTVRPGSASHRFVPGMLPLLLELHEERASVLLPLCGGELSDRERQTFLQRDYLKSVKAAWLHLAEYYAALTGEEREAELRAYLNLRLPKEAEGKPLKGRGKLWLAALGAAVRLRSLAMLKLLLSLTGAARGNVKP